MSDHPMFQLPDNIEIDPIFFDRPDQLCIRLNQPLPSYEAINLFSLTGGEEAPEECQEVNLRPLFNSIDLDTAPSDYLRMYFFDPTQGQTYTDIIKCRDALISRMPPHPPDQDVEGTPFEIVRVIDNADKMSISRFYLSPLGVPHKTYCGEGVQLAIAETLWDIAKLIEEAFGLKVEVENPALKKCREVQQQIDPDKFSTHAINAYGVIIHGMAAICPDAHPFAVTVADEACDLRWAKAIRGLGNRLNPGDVLLLEGQYAPEQGTLWPLELQPENAIFQAIQEIVRNGIVVIEPMGNVVNGGNVDLDQWLPNVQHHSFDADEQFRQSPRDSGAILVAASKRPSGVITAYPGTNIGARADLNAPGISLDPLVDSLPFAQTSVAAALITGIAVAAQSAVKAKGRRPLNSLEMRYYLKASGSDPVDKIGVMPNLRHFLKDVLGIEES